MPFHPRRAVTSLLVALLGVGALSTAAAPTTGIRPAGVMAADLPAARSAGAAERVVDDPVDTPGSAVVPAERPAKAGMKWLPASVEAAERAQRARAGLTAASVPASASGHTVTVPGAAGPPRAAARVMTLRVEVEDGLPVDGTAFADHVMTILNDGRGWGHDGSVVFARTEGPADAVVVLASGALTDELCAPLRTLGEVSCASGGRAVLNVERWSVGAEPFLAGGGTVVEYREYLVNHEVGHLLGHPHHACPGAGQVAPVMVQQTLDLGGCTPAGWPFPPTTLP